jgi:hypothetical protein
MGAFEELDSIRDREADVCPHECHVHTLPCKILEPGKLSLGRIGRQHSVIRSKASTQGRYSLGSALLVSVTVHDEQNGQALRCTVRGPGDIGHGYIKVRLPRPGAL